MPRGEADDQFARQDDAGEVSVELAERHGSDGEGRDLHAGVAALAGDDRQEDGERGDAGEGALEGGHDRRGGEGGGEIEQQPWRAASQRGEHGSGERFVVDQSDESIHVLGRFLLRDVEQIVGGRDADESAVVVEHRQRVQSVALENLQRVFLVDVGRHGRADRRHQVAEGGHWRGEHDLVQPDGAEQNAVEVDDVDGVLDGWRRRGGAQDGERLFGGDVRSEHHQLGAP